MAALRRTEIFDTTFRFLVGFRHHAAEYLVLPQASTGSPKVSIRGLNYNKDSSDRVALANNPVRHQKMVHAVIMLRTSSLEQRCTLYGIHGVEHS